MNAAATARAALVTIALLGLGQIAPGSGHAQAPAAPALDPKAVLQALEDAFVAVADRVTPSVVNVSVKPRRPAPGESGEAPEGEERFRQFFGEEFFERYFRRRPPREEARASGSGVIVDARGYILTNHHVVEQAGDIEVRLSDDRKFKASLVGRDAKSDLAVLRIDAPPASLPVADLGDSDRLRIGQWAIAIGNPFGLDRTVTVGIVSATGRTRVGVTTYEAFIQTDASINPGNSGGPLLNLQGQVIGINTAIAATGQGIGFSIPINMARDIMTQLVAQGRVVRGWLGIVIQDLTEDLAAGFGVGTDGVLVSDVMPDSPALAAGLRAGDVVVEFDRAPIKEVTDLQKRVAAVAPGRSVPVTVMRDRRRLSVDVRIGEQPSEDEALAALPREQGFGLTVEPVTPEAAEALKLPAVTGVVVTAVEPNSAGAEAGIRPGDVILELDRRPVTGVEAFRRAMVSVPAGASVPVYIRRRGEGRGAYVVLKAPEARH